MASQFAAYAGRADIGTQQKKNEDYISFTELGEDALLAVVSDGSGSGDTMFQPATVVSNHISTVIRRIYDANKELLFRNSGLFLSQACMTANDTLIGVKIGNEENNGGFAATVTGCLIQRPGKMTFMHAGNTRLYHIRNGKILQFTKDHTQAQDLVDTGYMTEEQYYTAIERLTLKNGIGVSPNPYITTIDCQLRKNDLLVLTTDGVHYAIRSEAMRNLILSSADVEQACDAVIRTVRAMKEGYKDNLSIEVIQFLGGGDEKKN